MNFVGAYENAVLLEGLLRSGVLAQLVCVLGEEDRLEVLLLQHNLSPVLHQIVLVFHQVALHQNVGSSCELRDGSAAILALLAGLRVR